jgi:hypothetical protein
MATLNPNEKEGSNVERKLLSLVVAAGLLLWGVTGTVFAGIEPSPWQPQLGMLHSANLNMDLIQKSLDTLLTASPLPRGTKIVLAGIKAELSVLDAQLADVLATLPSYNERDLDQVGVFFALEGIRINALSMEDPLGYILWRMGIEPSPWKQLLDSISGRISNYYLGGCMPGATCR